MFQKAMYILWPDDNYIDKAIETGVDTFVMSLPHSTPEIVDALFEKYHSQAKIIPCENWTDVRKIPVDQQMVYKGLRYENTACPLSLEFIKDRFNIPLELIKRYPVDSIAMDLEAYGAGGLYAGALAYHRDWDKDLRCECDRCEGLDQHEQRTINSNNISKVFGSLKIIQFPNVNPYIWKICEWWYNEFTYEDWSAWKRILKNTWKIKRINKVTILNSVGKWMEQMTADEYLNQLEKAAKSSAADGYWLYPQMRISKNCFWRLHPNDPYSKASLPGLKYKTFIDASIPESDPEFFKKLKELNDNIDDWRSGWWFDFRRWISGWFR